MPTVCVFLEHEIKYLFYMEKPLKRRHSLDVNPFHVISLPIQNTNIFKIFPGSFEITEKETTRPAGGTAKTQT